MRTTYHKNTEKSGVRLLLLLENHLREILKREEENRTLSIFIVRSLIG